MIVFPRYQRQETVAGTDYAISGSLEDGAVRIELRLPKARPIIMLAEPDETYNFAQAILRGYDEAVGIAETPPFYHP